jgi:hypothetical protein
MAAGTADRGTALGHAQPRVRQWRLAAGIGPVATGWVLGIGALVHGVGTPAWAVAAMALEAAIGVTLAALLLIRSAALVAWWAGAAVCAAGWVAYAAVYGPWTWTGEVSLLLPAAVLTLLWPLAHSRMARRGG